MDPSPETRKRKDEPSDENKATIAHRRRVWQVRKYCQVRPSMVQYSPDGSDSGKEDCASALLHGKNETADPALAALLKGVVKQLDADIVMISLLDEHTQYFLSGATGDNINDAGISLESAQWYGCDSISHHGGLCERTNILEHQPGAPAFYEELDLGKTQRTQNLPYVNGTTADFRHYVGMPIASPDGLNIGTVFAMSKTPARDNLSEPQQQYLYQTTKHVMRQLVQSVQALEGKRAERHNEALSALLNDHSYEHDHLQESRDYATAPRGPTEVSDVYRAAGERLHEFLDLSGLIFQELSLSTRHSTLHFLDEDTIPQDTVIMSKLEPGIGTVVPLDAKAVSKILEAFPNGGVLHVDDSGEVPIFAGAISYDTRALDAATNASLNRSFPHARQIIFTPLWDAVRNRNTALCVGWVLGDDRILRPETDLNAMSSFCMATISIISRIESRWLNRVKSDFIGSISHETRSPLHNILGNLDLALATTHCSPQLREMLVDARFGATQLLETIDKILLHSGVQSQATAVPIYQPLHLSNDGSSPHQVKVQNQGHVVQTGKKSREEYPTSGDTSLVDLCEEVVEDVAKRMRLSDTILSSSIERKAELNQQDNIHDNGRNVANNQEDDFSIIIFDAHSTDNCQIGRHSAFRIILENLLSNAIKFSQSRYCVRSSVRLDRNYCYLDVVDSGRGFSEDFMKHSLFVPFSQQDPVDSGMGLGLSLVKRNVEQLEGNVVFETDETLGSKAAIILPLPNLIAGVEQRIEDGYHPGTAVIPPMPVCDMSELPILKASVYFPKWFGQDDKRGERSVRLLHGSLASTLEAWFQPKITIWHQGSDQGFPDLVFIAHPDLESFQESSGEAFTNVKKVAVCADVGKNSEYDARKIDAASKVADAIITGSILPSKLWKAVTLFFPQIIPSRNNAHKKRTSDPDEVNPSNDRLLAASDGSGLQSGPSAGVEQIDHHCESSGARLPVRTAKPAQDARQDTKYDSNSTRNIDETKPQSAQNKLLGDEPEASIAKHGSGVDDQTSDACRTSQTSDSSEAPADKEKNHRVLVEQVGKQEQGTGEQHQEENDDDGSKPPTQPKILLVDDNNVNLKMLTMFVKKCGIDAANYAQATGGQQAIDLYEKAAGSKDAFDIVFMDLSMPEISGFEATSAIRRVEGSRSDGKRSQIVALTGLVSDKDRRAAELAGTDEYITKPAGLKTVKEVIDKWDLEVNKALSVPDI